MRKVLFGVFTVVLVVAFGRLALGNSGFPASGQTADPSVRYENIEIQSGDTLWDIAVKYQTEGQKTTEFVNKIKKFNHLKNDVIYAGQHLIVPVGRSDPL